MPKIGNNEPCPCGSGKKYKKCCKMSVKPLESFVVKVDTNKHKLDAGPKYLVRDNDGPWRPTDEIPPIEIVGVYGRELDLPGLSEFNKLRSKYSSLLKEKKYQQLSYHLGNLNHKLNGVYYNLQNFKNHEDEIIKSFQIDYEPTTLEQSITEHELTYELESFLMQVKSCLDFLGIMIESTFTGKYGTKFGKNGDKLISCLENNVSQEILSYAKQVCLVIKNNQSWTQETIEMRDIVAHISELKGFMSFIHRRWDGSNHAEITYPSMPNGQRVRKYMDETWDHVIEFIKSVLVLLLDATKINSKP